MLLHIATVHSDSETRSLPFAATVSPLTHLRVNACDSVCKCCYVRVRVTQQMTHYCQVNGVKPITICQFWSPHRFAHFSSNAQTRFGSCLLRRTKNRLPFCSPLRNHQNCYIRMERFLTIATHTFPPIF